MGTEKMKSMNMPSAGGCHVFSEKTMWLHDWQHTFDGMEVCVKCGSKRVAAPMRAGRID
jgi:hypothetical protein